MLMKNKNFANITPVPNPLLRPPSETTVRLMSRIEDVIKAEITRAHTPKIC
jgi:hypothetical protein